MIKPHKCLHLQLFSLFVCRHTQRELRGDVKRDDNRALWMSSLARMVIQVQSNNVCVKNCEGKADTGLHASQAPWKSTAQEQLKGSEGVGSQGKKGGAKKPSTRGVTQSVQPSF